MKKTLLVCFILGITLVACKNKTNSERTLNASIKTEEDNSEIIPSDYYCKVSFGNDKENVEYGLSSSNALRKGTVITTFGISLSDIMYEKLPLDLGFTKVQTTTNPRLVKGKYDLKPLNLASQDTLLYFSVGERIVSEDTYQKAIDTNSQEDFQDSFVLISNETNEFIITSVKDIGNVEDGLYYKTGQQEVKGNATVTLLKISNEKKLKYRVDFNCLHDWSMSKSNKQ